jgi:hypothetical protein
MYLALRIALARVGILPSLVFSLSAFRLVAGIVTYWVTAKTPQKSYQAMIRLFCSTRGRSNDFLSAIITLFRPNPAAGQVEGVIGSLDRSRIAQIEKQLEEMGYYVFEQRLSEQTCARILEYSLNKKALIRCGDGIPKNYVRGSPQGIRYDFDRGQLLEDQEILKLTQDPALRAIAGAYLKARPILDTVEMWWHTNFASEPDAEAAQLFHFDMDRIKWLKFFFYITDVGPENGPHCFVSGSHRTGGIPDALLRQGYARITDDEVLKHYPRERIIEFTAPRGTIIAEDTRGLHKGKHVHAGDRLVFQIQFTNSGFAGAVPQPLEKINVQS